MIEILKTILYPILCLFDVSGYKHITEQDIEEIYVKRRLEEWKLSLFAINNLDTIPSSRIYEKKLALIKEFKNKKHK